MGLRSSLFGRRAAATAAPPPLNAPAAPPPDADETPLRLRDALALKGRLGPARRLAPAHKLPLIGGLPLQKQLSVLSALLALSLTASLLLLVANTRDSAIFSVQTQLASDALMHSQRLGKAAPNAVEGNLDAFRQLRESRTELNQDLTLMAQGGSYAGRTIGAPGPALAMIVADARKNWSGTEQAAEMILSLKPELTGLRGTLRELNAMAPVLLAQSEDSVILALESGAQARDLAVLGRMMMLIQRMRGGADELLTADGISPAAALLLVRDPVYVRAALDGFLNGSAALQLRAVREPQLREHFAALRAGFGAYDYLLSSVVGQLDQAKAAHQAARLIFSDNEELRQRLALVLQAYRSEHDTLGPQFWLMAATGLLTLIAAAGMGRILLEDSANRTRGAERSRLQADAERALSQHQERAAKASNDQIQAAILRLMNELQTVADGDLTVQATVSADITGAIADSINYTVEELRALVGRVTATAEQVSQASADAQQRSGALLTASQQQSREIEQASATVVRLARDITAVSASASESAEVARQSVAAAGRGAAAVENAIVGMHEIREQIQATSKRIKRLSESSQEIGEITELISDITEQTNVLALNAAIQAASAGAAGRGFSVVAEEVQRLAERSAAAARQIGALVRTIQTDTRDAATAMEKSTRGVLEGARLSDAAGAALSDIGDVSQRLAELIQAISVATGLQATSAGAVAKNIGHILSVTEQTQGGTEQTAQSIHRLALLAQELKNSVARFRVVA